MSTSNMTFGIVDVVQFTMGGLLTVAASKLTSVYGAKIGALAWTVPILLYVSIISLWLQGKPKNVLSDFCFYSFGTTLVNAVAGLLIGLIILGFSNNFIAAIGVSIVTSAVLGYTYHQLHHLLSTIE